MQREISMNHSEAMKRRWTRCWYYPAAPKKHLSESHYQQTQKNRQEWYAKWDKEILKEAKQYVKAYEKLSKKDREILEVGSINYNWALEIIGEAKEKKNDRT
jgi:hypothetical protein